MIRRHIDWSSSLLVSLLLFALPAAARADNVLSIGDFTIAPGQTGLVIPIELTSTDNLTVLSFDVAFTPATDLCNALVTPTAITTRRAGRTSADPLEETITCASGTIRIAIFDFTGRVLIAAGSGPVFEVVLGDVAANAAGVVSFSLQNISASAGAGTATVTTPNTAQTPVVKSFGTVTTTLTVTTTSTTATTLPTTTTTATTSTSTTETTAPTTSSTTATTPTTTSTTLPAVCGNSQIEGDEECDPPGGSVCPPALPGGENTDCQADCVCPGNALLDADVAAGGTVLEVDDMTGFDIGDTIRINPGGANQEDNTITGFGSLLLGTPLAFDHAADEEVVELPPGTTTTTTTETTSTSTTSTAVSSTTTTTTGGGLCGNGVLDPGEECDPPWSRNIAQCPPRPGFKFGPECGDDCRCLVVTTTSTTTTTLGGLCGNGRLDPGEECDPPWSRNPEQCPPRPGFKFGPECGDDCRCVTVSTTTATTTSTVSTTTESTTTSTTTETTTTSTSSTSTTTIPSREEIQCCITRSPEPAFPDAVTCEFLKAFECDAFGGVNKGPGTCDPNPCLTSTTTEPTRIVSCTRAATMPSVACRLGKLIAMVNEFGDLRGLRGKLLAPLQHADARMHRAEQLGAAGRTRKARSLLRQATRDLRVFRARVSSRRASRLLSPTARDIMLGLAGPLGVDLKALSL